MIVLEGCDGAGKSTLGEQLAKAYQLPLVHQKGGPNRTQEELFADMRERNERQKTELVIYDRIPIISENVYGKILRGHSRMENPEGLVMFNQWIETKPLLIYCRPPVSRLVNSELIKKEHDSAEHIDQLKTRIVQVSACYDDLMINLFAVMYGRVYVYNWKNEEAVLRTVERRIFEFASDRNLPIPKSRFNLNKPKDLKSPNGFLI